MSVRSFQVVYIVLVLVSLDKSASAQASENAFVWPDGKKLAISLTFDDARSSQVLKGTPLLDEYGVRATFYVVPAAVKRNLEGWKRAVASGHEIGNHSLHHPCSGNFNWSRNHALEDYSSAQMRSELKDANRQIQDLLDVSCVSFAYPCGQTFTGRGKGVKSYVPVVAALFTSGRGWMNEIPNDPVFCDFSQLTGIESDGKDFAELLPLIEAARENHQWLVLAGHETDEKGPQTTRLSMLRELLAYAAKPENGVWIATVKEVRRYVESQRK